MLTAAALRHLMPRCPDPAAWAATLHAAATEWTIATPGRLAAWLANIAAETGELRHLEENLAYRAERLMAVWPRRFPTMDEALPFDRQAERIANRVYAARMGNGDESSGDGWRYRGRGCLMLTGRAAYAAAGAALGLPLKDNPDLLLQPVPAARAAGWYWWQRGLRQFIDHDDFDGLCRAINGGGHGLDARRAYYRTALETLDP